MFLHNHSLCVNSESVGSKPKTKLWFKTLQWAQSKALMSFRAMWMSYSTCRGGRGVRLIFQSTDHWHTIGVMQPSVRGRTREEKGTAFHVFPNYMFAELKGKEVGNIIIYQLPLSVCCTLEDISATLFTKKKKWACWILTWSVILGQDTLMGEHRHHNHCTDRSCSSCSPRALVLPHILCFCCSIQCNSFKFHKNRIVSQERNCPFWKDTNGCIVTHISIYQNLSYRMTYKKKTHTKVGMLTPYVFQKYKQSNLRALRI